MFLHDSFTSSFNFSVSSEGSTLEVSKLVISTVGAESTTYSYWSSLGASFIAFSVTSFVLLFGHLALLSKVELYAFFEMILDFVLASIRFATTLCAIESPTYKILGLRRKAVFSFLFAVDVHLTPYAKILSSML